MGWYNNEILQAREGFCGGGGMLWCCVVWWCGGVGVFLVMVGMVWGGCDNATTNEVFFTVLAH